MELHGTLTMSLTEFLLLRHEKAFMDQETMPSVSNQVKATHKELKNHLLQTLSSLLESVLHQMGKDIDWFLILE